ncbi:MAG: response regulator transcription factor [Chloroflexota bacterium]
MIRVLLVEDHPVVREGLRLLLEQQADLEVVGETGRASDAIALAAELAPDVVLMDIGLGSDDGVPVIESIRSRIPATRVLVLSMFVDGETVRQALLAGAAGYVVKGASADELVAAIRAVAAGGTFLHSAIAGVVLDDGLRWLHAGAPLSPREREVLSLLAGGRSASLIARGLGISTNTVRRHLANTAEKLGIHGSRALSQYARQHGLARPMPEPVRSTSDAS